MLARRIVAKHDKTTVLAMLGTTLVLSFSIEVLFTYLGED